MQPIIPFIFAKRHSVLWANAAEVYYTEDTSLQVLLELQRCSDTNIRFTSISQETFNQELAQRYQTNTEEALQHAALASEDSDFSRLMAALPKQEDLLDDNSDAPIIRLLNALLSEAIKRGASDVHIECYEQAMVVRFRLDGMLHKIAEPQYNLAPLIVSRIKVMAKLNIAEKRLPQDGRVALNLGKRQVDVRVSTLPTRHGERVVLRLLDKRATPLDLSQLGLNQPNLVNLQKIIHKPHGIVLVTGPTGSGKTTTLYAALTELHHPTKNILTVEDPVEYYLPGIGQMQVNTKAQLTFAKGLRAILRQDPDIVMVGEIRDLETATTAVQASLTGHLVLSTLHTNTAVGAITRLRDMGIEDFLIASSLVGVVAQRLVRILCAECKLQKQASAEECHMLQLKTSERPLLYEAQGCVTCLNLGYRGRSAIYEVIAIDHELQALISHGANEQQLNAAARQLAASIRDDGMARVIKGETSLAEVVRVLGEG
jgi:general secretion pathway protein E